MIGEAPERDPSDAGNILGRPAVDPTLTRPSDSGPAFAGAPAVGPGLRIGAYEIEREPGSGGMGAVYLAHRADSAFEKKVAHHDPGQRDRSAFDSVG